MGLMDDMLAKLGVGGAQGQGGMLAHVTELINGSGGGGLGGLVQQFEAKGLGGIVRSWIGTGPNEPITAEQIVHALGADRIQKIATTLGVPPEQVSAKLSEMLPTVIDKLTPAGQLPVGPVTLPH